MSKDSDITRKKEGPLHIFGCGRLGELENIVKELSPDKILLVTGKSSYTKTGLKPRLEKMFSTYETLRYSDFSPNPQPKELLKGANKVKEFGPDIIIALGGGSVMDTAKLISVLPPDKKESLDIIRGNKEVPKRKIPLILVPTTAGTGSECTHFAVVYDGDKKYSVADLCLIPDYSIADPELTAAMPESIAASSGFDAFCQAVESYWAVGSTEESRRYAAKSIKLFRENFLKFVKKRDKRSCENMVTSAHLAGKAINISKTTGPHALSYALTIHYGIPHGYGVILTLPEFFILNGSASEDDMSQGVYYKEHSQRMKELCSLLESASPQEAAEKIRQTVKSAGFSTKLSRAGVEKREDIEKLAESVNLQRLKNNPVKVTKEQIKDLLENIW